MRSDNRVRSTGLLTTPVPADFSSGVSTPIVITADGRAWVLLTDQRVVQIGEGMSMEQEVATTGLYRGKSAKLIPILGSRALGWSGTAVLGDACSYLDTSQARQNVPTVGQTLYLVSTSASDTAAGAGARTVRTVYLDANGLERVRTDTLNGTGAVSIGSGYTAIQWIEVATVGSAVTAVGDLSVTSTNGAATVATTFERIVAGANRSLSGRYKLPADCVGYLLQYHVNAIGNTMDCRLRGDFFSDDGGLSEGVFHFLDRAFILAGQGQATELSYRKVPAGATIKISAFPGGAPAGNKLDCDFSLICVAV